MHDDGNGAPLAPGAPDTPPTPEQTPPASPPASPPPVDQAARPSVDYVPRQHFDALLSHVQALRDEVARSRTPKPAPPPPDAEADAIRQQFFKLFPAAEKLFGLPVDRVAELLDQAPHLNAQAEHYWSTFGAHMLRSLDERVRQAYGGAPDAKARRWIEVGFIDWVENDPTARQRYLAQDPSLVSDYWTFIDGTVLAPARRSALATEQQRATKRAALPSAGPRTQPVGTPPPTPKDEDELHAAAWAALQAQR